jgi:hypothetical protein
MIPDDDFYYVLYQRRGLDDRKRFVWYFYFYDESHRKVRRSTGFTNRKKAVAYVNKLIASGRLRDSAVSSSKVTFCDFAKPFWIWETCPYVTNVIKRGGHYSKDLCKSNLMCMEKHILPTFGEVKLSRITKDMINDWLICLPDAHKISNKSANAMRLILYHRGFFKTPKRWNKNTQIVNLYSWHLFSEGKSKPLLLCWDLSGIRRLFRERKPVALLQAMVHFI